MCFMLPDQEKVGTRMFSYILVKFLKISVVYKDKNNFLSNISKTKPFRV